jgi:hypothetical protein
VAGTGKKSAITLCQLPFRSGILTAQPDEELGHKSGARRDAEIRGAGRRNSTPRCWPGDELTGVHGDPQRYRPRRMRQVHVTRLIFRDGSKYFASSRLRTSQRRRLFHHVSAPEKAASDPRTPG